MSDAIQPRPSHTSMPPLSDEIPADICDHVVVLNANSKLPHIVRELEVGARGKPLDIIVVVQDRMEWDRNKEWRPKGYAGNIYLRSTLHKESRERGGEQDLSFTRMEKARAAVVLADPLQGELADAHSILSALAIEKLNRKVHTVVELISSINREHLQSLCVDAVVCSGELTENLIAQSCFSPGIMGVIDNLMSAEEETCQLFIVELPENLVGRTYRDIALGTMPLEGPPSPLVLCGFFKGVDDDPANDDIVINPGRKTLYPYLMNYNDGYSKDTILETRDRLIIIAYDLEASRKFLQTL